MKKVILSAVLIAAVTVSCSDKDSNLPEKTESKVFINLEALDNDGVTTTETPTNWVIVKH